MIIMVGSSTSPQDNSPSQSSQQANEKSSGYKGLILTTAVLLGAGSLLISNYETIKVKKRKIKLCFKLLDIYNEILQIY